MKKNILLLTDSSFVGGPEKYIIGYIKEIKNDFNIIVSAYLNGRPENDFLEEAARQNQKVIPLQSQGSYNPKQILELLTIIKKNEIHLINTHGYRANFIGYICAKKAGIKQISTFHGWTSSDNKLKLLESLDKKVLKRVNHIIAVSEGNKKKMINLGIPEHNITVVPNAIDWEVIENYPQKTGIRDELGIAPNIKLVGTVGRLSKEKGQKDLLYAFKSILTDNRDCMLIIAGDGPEKERLMSLAQKLRIDEKVKFLGFRRDALNVMRALDIFVLPSYTEGLPTVILEAFAFSKPVIATAVGGTPELIQNNETGLLVSAGQPQELAEAIMKILGDSEFAENLGRHGHALLKQKYLFSKNKDLLNKTITNVILSKPASVN